MMRAVFFMANVGNRPWRIVHSEASLGWGGQERRVMAELLGFRARGHAVGLLAPALAKIFFRSDAAWSGAGDGGGEAVGLSL